MMKRNLSFLYLVLFLSLALVSCREDEPEIGEPFGKSEGLTATSWVVDQVFLVNETNPSRPQRDISRFYTSNNNLLEINFDSDGTFETTAGDGVNFFPESGTWSFNDSFAPTKITLVSPDQVIESPLGGPTRISDNELRMNVQRFCNSGGEEKAVLGYELVFVRKS